MTATVLVSRYPGEPTIMPREKTLDGLLLFLARRLTAARYGALVRTAAAQGLSLRDYVGRYVVKMVERKFAERRVA